ncbi:MAG: MBL fold metallo-hydrolase [Gemmatimonadetes bacterium]|nr:MBL fold metallo-hydrolase [Gemmatimonadota bacterium]
MLEVEGTRLLFDPVWAERASFVTFAGPKRFFAPPLPFDELPAVDAIVLSHDHYDHLDRAFVESVHSGHAELRPKVRSAAGRSEQSSGHAELRPKVRSAAGRSDHRPRWIVPLGVGDWLRAWGVAASDVTELDWWDATRVGTITLTSTPARHFSGRGLTSTDKSLWCGWAVVGERRRVYYAGDTALQNEFSEIGQRLGPFDLTMIEIGAYDALWPDVHLGPEQAVLAHRLVRGDVMLPLHWGTFDLALHGWTEPIERALVAAKEHGMRIATPRPGGIFEPTTAIPAERWWPTLPWHTAAEKPIHSTGIHLQGRP